MVCQVRPWQSRKFQTTGSCRTITAVVRLSPDPSLRLHGTRRYSLILVLPSWINTVLRWKTMQTRWEHGEHIDYQGRTPNNTDNGGQTGMLTRTFTVKSLRLTLFPNLRLHVTLQKMKLTWRLMTLLQTPLILPTLWKQMTQLKLNQTRKLKQILLRLIQNLKEQIIQPTIRVYLSNQNLAVKCLDRN